MAATETTKAKKNLTWREYNLIFTVLGIAIVLAAYFLGFQKLTESNTKLTEEIGTRGAYLTQLNNCYDNYETYKKGIAISKSNITENLAKLPKGSVANPKDKDSKENPGIKDEDFLLYLMEANKKCGGDLQTVDFEPSSLIAEFKCYVGDKETKVTGYRIGTTSSGAINYKGLKAYLDYIYKKTNNTTFIDNLSVSYDAETARLIATIGLSKYYIDYDGGKYVQVPAKDVSTGTQNPFGASSAGK